MSEPTRKGPDKNQIFGEQTDNELKHATEDSSVCFSWYINDYEGPAIFGRESKDQANFGQSVRSGGSCFGLRKWSAATFPRPLSIHVVVTAARAPIGVAMRWRASATLAPVTTTSTAARARKRGRSRVELPQTSGQEVRALHVPYRADTHGLSQLITVSRNR
jgi:hypothetical protein